MKTMSIIDWTDTERARLTKTKQLLQKVLARIGSIKKLPFVIELISWKPDWKPHNDVGFPVFLLRN